MATSTTSDVSSLPLISILDLEINEMDALSGKRCVSHSEQFLNFYCKKCHIAICHECTVVAHRQLDGHRIFEMKNILPNYEQRFDRRKEIHMENLRSLDSCLTKYSEVISKLESMKANLLKQIKEDLKQNIQTLEVRAGYLCRRIGEICDHHSKQLTSNQDSMKSLKISLDVQLSEFDRARCKSDVVTTMDRYRKMKKDENKNKAMITECCEAAKFDNLKVVFEEDAVFQNKLQFRGKVLGLRS